MTISIDPVRSDFVARVEGIDLKHALDAASFAVVRQALDEHSILIFSDQPMNDQEQKRFSDWWGPMEPTKGVNPASGTPFARQSNLDIDTGEVIAPDDRRMDYQKGNYQWHADSTFKPTPSLCSILTARIVPPIGGNTEFVSTRRLYEGLDEDLRERCEGLIVEHNIAFSRARVGFKFTPEEEALHPSSWHPLVQTNPVTGRHSLLIGAHAARILGWSDHEAAEFLDELLERATRPEAVYSHAWRQGDIIIWDNRSALHRATAYDGVNHRRLMQRTTIGNPDILNTAAYARVRAQRQGA